MEENTKIPEIELGYHLGALALMRGGQFLACPEFSRLVIVSLDSLKRPQQLIDSCACSAKCAKFHIFHVMGNAINIVQGCTGFQINDLLIPTLPESDGEIKAHVQGIITNIKGQA
jgi:hypothetical protein